MRSPAHRLRAVAAIVAATLATPVLARDLVDVPPIDYFPLRIDKATLKQEGKKFSFSYIIDVPKNFEGRKAKEGERGSNEVETVIDCAAETYTLGKVTVFSKARGEGEVETVLPAAVDGKPLRIFPNSTAGYLAEFVCP